MKYRLYAIGILGFYLSCAGTPSWALELNEATVAELDSINGIGPAKSRQILAARERGLFTSWDDLMQRVAGVKQKTASRYSAQGLTVNALSFEPRDGTLASPQNINPGGGD